MIIGIEGVSCTGKTTLAAALASALGDPLVIGCYYHCAPDPACLPNPDTATGEEQLAGLQVLLRVEKLRYDKAMVALTRGDDVILDRSVDTLLAHTHAMGQRHGFDIDDDARALVQSHQVVIPDLTLLLYARPDTLSQRAAQRVNMPRVFYAPQLTKHFHEHFTYPLAHQLVRISTDLPFPDTLTAARTAVALHRTIAPAVRLAGAR
jgi:dTMP kinase